MLLSSLGTVSGGEGLCGLFNVGCQLTSLRYRGTGVAMHAIVTWNLLLNFENRLPEQWAPPWALFRTLGNRSHVSA